jgi:hypothetical protein
MVPTCRVPQLNVKCAKAESTVASEDTVEEAIIRSVKFRSSNWTLTLLKLKNKVHLNSDNDSTIITLKTRSQKSLTQTSFNNTTTAMIPAVTDSKKRRRNHGSVHVSQPNSHRGRSQGQQASKKMMERVNHPVRPKPRNTITIPDSPELPKSSSPALEEDPLEGFVVDDDATFDDDDAYSDTSSPVPSETSVELFDDQDVMLEELGDTTPIAKRLRRRGPSPERRLRPQAQAAMSSQGETQRQVSNEIVEGALSCGQHTIKTGVTQDEATIKFDPADHSPNYGVHTIKEDLTTFNSNILSLTYRDSIVTPNRPGSASTLPTPPPSTVKAAAKVPHEQSLNNYTIRHAPISYTFVPLPATTFAGGVSYQARK